MCAVNKGSSHRIFSKYVFFKEHWLGLTQS